MGTTRGGTPVTFRFARARRPRNSVPGNGTCFCLCRLSVEGTGALALPRSGHVVVLTVATIGGFDGAGETAELVSRVPARGCSFNSVPPVSGVVSGTRFVAVHTNGVGSRRGNNGNGNFGHSGVVAGVVHSCAGSR